MFLKKNVEHLLCNTSSTFVETLLPGSFRTFVDPQTWAGIEDSAAEVDAIELVAVSLVLQTPVLVIVVVVTVGRAAGLLVLLLVVVVTAATALPTSSTSTTSSRK